MADLFRTMICTAAEAPAAREAAAAVPGGEGMFTAGLSPTGEAPATDYISSGYVSEEIVLAVTPLIAVVTEADAQTTMAAMGLQIVSD